MTQSRYLTQSITDDALAAGKMAFIAGPRQVGKTTLARVLVADTRNYFLHDDEAFRRAWAKSPTAAIAGRGGGPIVLDEIHKDRAWKRKLKGLYDQPGSRLPIIVTGSARMGYYRKGGDSLLGRYLPYQLHPFSVGERASPPRPDAVLGDYAEATYPWSDLLRLGGFPEPLIGGRVNLAQRWSRLRLDRLVFEDSRDIRQIGDLRALATLVELLPERVGSLLSVNALHQDVGKAYATVRAWVELLDILYFSFTVRPYAHRLRRVVKAEPKLYLYDILRIPERELGKRRENLAALHLLKACHYWTDTAQGEFELRFVRDKDGREIDFLVLRDKAPWMAIECKSGATDPARNLVHFSELLRVPHRIQLVSEEGHDRFFAAAKVRVINYERFFAALV